MAQGVEQVRIAKKRAVAHHDVRQQSVELCLVRFHHDAVLFNRRALTGHCPACNGPAERAALVFGKIESTPLADDLNEARHFL